MVQAMMRSQSKGKLRTLMRRRFCSTKPKQAPAEEKPIGIMGQIMWEVTNSRKSAVAGLGFAGACINWTLGLSGAYEVATQSAENIDLEMKCILIVYSGLFGRWAGWAVSPRNYVLAGSHIFNISMQGVALARCLKYKLEEAPNGIEEVKSLATKAAIGGAVMAGYVMAAPAMQAMVAPYGGWVAGAAGPFTIHPWPPVTKLFLSGKTLKDFQSPVNEISSSATYASLTVTGALFAAYGLKVTPINYPLWAVNVLLMSVNGAQLFRIAIASNEE